MGNVAARKPDPRLVVESLGIGADEQSQFLQTFLGVSPRTVKRRLGGEAPSKGERFQLEMLANVNELANEMFGSQENARRFLTTPLPARPRCKCSTACRATSASRVSSSGKPTGCFNCASTTSTTTRQRMPR
jgi:hypothetical protein